MEKENILLEIGNDYMDFFKEEYKPIIDFFGIETTLKICDFYGGCQTYIPTKKRLFMNPTKKYIMENYYNYNSIELCRKLDISTRTLNRIIKENLNK